MDVIDLLSRSWHVRNNCRIRPRRWIRNYAHVIVPFRDPISLTFVSIVAMPFLIDAFLSRTFPDPVGQHRVSVAVCCRYSSDTSSDICFNQINMEYVGVHNILEKVQDIYPIVYYYHDGKMYIQPQTFRGIFKTMILRVRYPLDLPMNQIMRRRTVKLRKVFMHLEAQVIDLAGHTVEKYDQKLGPFKVTVEKHTYIPAPYCMDAPYDWIVNTAQYDQMFREYSRLQVDAMESKAELQVASVKGAGMVLTALNEKTPSNMFLEELGIDMGNLEIRRQAIRDEIEHGAPVKEKKPSKKPKGQENEDGDD